MYIRLCKCVYIYIFVWELFLYIHIYAYMYIYIYMYIRLCMYVYIYMLLPRPSARDTEWPPTRIQITTGCRSAEASIPAGMPCGKRWQSRTMPSGALGYLGDPIPKANHIKRRLLLNYNARLAGTPHTSRRWPNVYRTGCASWFATTTRSGAAHVHPP